MNNEQRAVVSPVKLEEVKTITQKTEKQIGEEEGKHYTQSIYEAPEEELESL